LNFGHLTTLQNSAPSNDSGEEDSNEDYGSDEDDDYNSALKDIEPLAEVGATSSCVICLDSLPDQELATVICGHNYCIPCLVHTFTRSFIDEELFPPRCCQQPITPESVREHLTPEIESVFQAKTIEYGTQDRTYCSKNECQSFLTLEMLVREGTARCASCQTMTCTKCKGAAHEGECSQDEATAQLEVLATAERWKRCPGCHRMVELTLGCYHMS